MKKFLASILLIASIIGLTACGDDLISIQTAGSIKSTSLVSVNLPDLVSEPISKSEPELADTPAGSFTEEADVVADGATDAEDNWTFAAMDTVMYATTVVNVRDLPSLDGKRLGFLNQNDQVRVIGRCNETGWYKIEYKGGIAYVHCDYFADEKGKVQVSVENKNNKSVEATKTGTENSSSGATGASQSSGSASSNQPAPARNTGPYPDPLYVSLTVTPITTSNYASIVGSALSGTYKDDTVLGFAVSPNGIGSYMDLFDRIEFYVYDGLSYETNMKPISDALQSSNPAAGTTLTSVSSEGQGDESGKTYFYPSTDNNYVAKVSIAPTSSGTHLNNPRVIFLFSDFTGNQTVCQNALSSRTSGLVGAEYSVTSAVNGTFAGGGFSRGRDYEFTFRLHVDENAITDAHDRMYPEVLGEEMACILKAPTSYAAPFESPNYYFYPLDSDLNSLTYGYYIQTGDPDIPNPNFVFPSWVSTKGTVKSQTKTNYTNQTGTVTDEILKNEDAVVKVSDLRKNDQVSPGFVEYGYVSDYTNANTIQYLSQHNRGKRVTAFTKFFTGRNGTPRATFDATAGADAAQINLHFVEEDEAKSVAVVVGTFKGNGTGTGVKVRLNNLSLSGTEMTGNVRYEYLHALQDNNGNWPQNVTVSLTIYYDTGREGLQQDMPTDTAEENIKLYCIREAGENSEGHYIVPENVISGSAFLTNNQSNALGSIFAMSKTPSETGAQNVNINGTLSDAPGKVSILIRGFGGGMPTTASTGSGSSGTGGGTTTAFQYDTASNARAKFGGMYDSNITHNQLGFTISLVSSFEGIRTPNNQISATFSIPSTYTYNP